MKQQLLSIMLNEQKALKKLLHLLEKQHGCLARDEARELEECAKEIDEASKGLAKAEIERRKLVGERSMRELIEEMNDAFIKEIYRDIRHTIEGLTTQKETNDVMLKQKLSFTNSMLEALKPKNNKRAGTYNSYGKMKR